MPARVVARQSDFEGDRIEPREGPLPFLISSASPPSRVEHLLDGVAQAVESLENSTSPALVRENRRQIARRQCGRL